MLADVVLVAVAAVAIGSTIFIFKAKEITHAMAAFLIVAVAGAALLALLSLPLLALLQLFIMVGGVSTYLFVGVSSENLSKFRHSILPALLVLAIAVAAVPVYRISMISGLGSQSNVLSSSAIVSGMANNMTLFYMIGIVLFGIAIASIMVIKHSSLREIR